MWRWSMKRLWPTRTSKGHDNSSSISIKSFRHLPYSVPTSKQARKTKRRRKTKPKRASHRDKSQRRTQRPPRTLSKRLPSTALRGTNGWTTLTIAGSSSSSCWSTRLCTSYRTQRAASTRRRYGQWPIFDSQYLKLQSQPASDLPMLLLWDLRLKNFHQVPFLRHASQVQVNRI